MAALERIPGVREVHSLERLLDQVGARAARRRRERVKDEHRKVLDDIHRLDQGARRARRVLIVDDDMRNIFALSSVLEEYGMDIVSADNGRDAIAHRAEGATSTSS